MITKVSAHTREGRNNCICSEINLYLRYTRAEGKYRRGNKGFKEEKMLQLEIKSPVDTQGKIAVRYRSIPERTWPLSGTDGT